MHKAPSLGIYASLCKTNLPRGTRHDWRVTETPSQTLIVLAQNLERLRAANPAMQSQSAIARAAKVDQKTVGRILLMQHEPRIDVVEKLARAFGLETWHMFVPNLQPDAIPLLSQEVAGLRALLTEVLREGGANKKTGT